MTARTIGPKNLLLGLGAFAGGIAALAVGAVALATRRVSEGQGAKGEAAVASGDPAPVPESAAHLTDTGPTAQSQPAPTAGEGHAAPDLAAGGDLGPDHRALEAFRPDIDAPMTPAEREALRPATGPSPTLVSDQGGSVRGS